MAYRFFTVPIHDPRESELNAFLRSHRVLSVKRKWIDGGKSSCWTFCVDYLETTGGPPTGTREGGGPNRNKVDYRERLSPEDFTAFAKLREIRKQIAQAEAVPVYTVFTNEQLARMVQARATTKAALENVAGVLVGWAPPTIPSY
jgi:superfamily II DNA helicase RecQ